MAAGASLALTAAKNCRNASGVTAAYLIALLCQGGAREALVVCDMPYMSNHISPAETVRIAGRLMLEGRAQAVKLEGGADFATDIRALVRASIPVMGHLGMTTQSVNALGGFRVQGKTPDAAQRLLDDARAVEAAGAFALTLECVLAPLAERITQELSIPVIGIGAGAACDGQVLVWQDMAGLGERQPPRFVKRFGQVGQALRDTVDAYASDVRNGDFPGQEQCYAVPDGLEEAIRQLK
ncbi:MAG: 3-methyl-2-oxobutanoate hydroxymethyltransferase [Desulfovibrio sp.]|nr:3-methyl-2-oxobutanoate hydroxymethyltransferase [Desulfovibrio sp.]